MRFRFLLILSPVASMSWRMCIRCVFDGIVLLPSYCLHILPVKELLIADEHFTSVEYVTLS